MMVLCNAIVIIEYDGRRPGLPHATVFFKSNSPLKMTHIDVQEAQDT